MGEEAGPMMRHFELKLSYKEDSEQFGVTAVDIIMADNLVSLLAQFMVLIGSVHNRILDEERLKMRAPDDDIPF
jgi:hypothetical protein